MKELTIKSPDSNQRLDKYLKRVFPEMGTSFLYKMLRKKNITLNSKKATGSEQVKTGDLIQCFFSDETFDKFAGKNMPADDMQKAAGNNTVQSGHNSSTLPQNTSHEYLNAYRSLKGIKVIYEDEHILLLDKPAGILSQKAKPEDLSLNEWMIGYLLDSKAITNDSIRHFKPSVCNRLDRNTSGLVICGKTLLGSREMSRLLKDRSLQKYYHTYVYGKLEGSKVLEGYHQKDKNSNQAKILFTKPVQNIEQYDSIITAYRSLEAKENFSYLEIELITGKTHQIRAHLAAYGHPIVGDKKYACSNAVKYKNIAANKKDSCKDSDVSNNTFPKYQLLHAYRVVFPTLEGELAYLSNKEFVCEEPKAFHQFKNSYFMK